MITCINRDLRTGGVYDAEKDKAENGSYLHEAADIEVQVGVGAAYFGSNQTDDPSSIDSDDVAVVTEDVPRWNPRTGEIILDEFLFRAGDKIILTDDEVDRIRDDAMQEAYEEADHVEWSYDGEDD